MRVCVVCVTVCHCVSLCVLWVCVCVCVCLNVCVCVWPTIHAHDPLLIHRDTSLCCLEMCLRCHVDMRYIHVHVRVCVSRRSPMSRVSTTPSSASALRWSFHIPSWCPSPSHFAAALSLLSSCAGEAVEVTRIRRFHFPLDAQRALIGRLALRHAIHTVTGTKQKQKQHTRRTRLGDAMPRHAVWLVCCASS